MLTAWVRTMRWMIRQFACGWFGRAPLALVSE